MAKRIDPKADRKQKLEQLKREQRGKERRKTLVTVGIASLLGLALIGVVTVPAVLKDRKLNNEKKAAQREASKALSAFGVKAAEAACTEEKVDTPVPPGGQHVEQGQTVNYPSIPPSSGQHSEATAGLAEGFHAREEKVAPERAVHSLEHGLVVGWYDKRISAADAVQLRKIGAAATAKKLRFLAMPWDREDFPDNKPFVLTSWGRAQRCGKISGEVVDAFVKKNQDSKDAPERGGQA